MRLSARGAVATVAALAVLGLGGCGGTEADTGEAADSSPSPSTPKGTPSETPTTEDEDPSSPAETDDGAVEIEVEIEDGQVTPSGERVDVEVGQTVRFVVDSDAADEIHVHSTPEHTFGFKAGVDDKEFELTLQQPGVVEAELHEQGDVVVTLATRP